MNDVHVITTIAIFLTVQVIASVWWASKVNTLLGIVQKEVKEILAELKASRNIYVTQADCKMKYASVEKNIDALWKKVDEINHSI